LGPLRAETRKIVFLVLYVLLIYISIPFVWRVEVYLRSRHLLMVTVYLVVALYITALVLIMIRYAAPRWKAVTALTVFTVIYIVIIVEVRGFDKKIHFIEYGILTSLVHASLKLRLGKYTGYLASLAAVIAIGWVDELLQYFAPPRNYDMGDLMSNVAAALLMLILIFIIDRFRSSEPAQIN
jgi:VanZ family protein